MAGNENIKDTKNEAKETAVADKKAKTEISQEQVKDQRKAELEKKFEGLKNSYNEKVTEVRYIERILRLKDEMTELESEMDKTIQEYNELK